MDDMEGYRRVKEIRSNILHFLCNLHAANRKNGEGMQPIRKVQVLSRKFRFNMDHRSIPNPKSLIVFIRKKKYYCEVWMKSVWGKYSGIKNEE
jgi:hypothetical protein